MDVSPRGPEEAAAAAWRHAMELVNGQINGWSRRLADGQNPLKPGEAARLRTLIATAQTYAAMSTPVAQMTAAQWEAATSATREALGRTIDAVPAHAKASLDDFFRKTGWENHTSPHALAAVTERAQQAITKDFDRLLAGTQRTIADNLTKAVQEGIGPEELARRIRKQVGSSLGGAANRARVIARTELADVHDNAQREVYNQYGAMGLLYGYEWDARNDACPICYALHGIVFPYNQPPNRHHMCRCDTVPVLNDEELAKTPYGQPGPNAHQDEDAQRNRARLMQQPTPGWRPYWKLGPESDAAAWQQSRAGLPAFPAPQPPPKAPKAPKRSTVQKPAMGPPPKIARRPATKDNISAAERQGLLDWIGMMNDDVADYLRGRGKPSDRITGYIRQMDGLFQRTGTDGPVTLYRGWSTRGAVPRVGEAVADMAYTSASRAQDVAETYATAQEGLEGFLRGYGPEEKAVVLTIEVPPGTPAIDISGITGRGEREWLLDRGARIEIVGRTESHDGRVIHLTGRLVP